ncbi:hypothetical protein V8E36_009452 [Tilletia maclaganii]
MALKQSSSLASLRARFRTKSISREHSADSNHHSNAHNDSDAKIAFPPSSSSTTSPSSQPQASPTTLQNSSSSRSASQAAPPPASSSSSSSSSTNNGSNNNNGPAVNRWADAPPLPSIILQQQQTPHQPNKKGTDKMPLGYVPPAPSGSSSGSQFVVQQTKRNTNSHVTSRDAPISSPTQQPTPNLASRARMSAAEQGAQFLRQSNVPENSRQSAPSQQTGRLPGQLGPDQSAGRLPGQQIPNGSPRPGGRLPPSSAGQAIAASASQSRPPPPAGATRSASTSSKMSSSSSADAMAAKLKNRVSITPGKESWSQVQAREQRERENKEFARRSMMPGGPGSQGGMHGYGGGGGGRAASASQGYASAGPGPGQGMPPQRSLSHNTRASYMGSPPSASSGAASAYARAPVPGGPVLHHSPQQQQRLPPQQAGGERSRSMYVASPPSMYDNLHPAPALHASPPSSAQHRQQQQQQQQARPMSHIPPGASHMHSPSSASNGSLISSTQSGNAFPEPPLRGMSTRSSAQFGSGQTASPQQQQGLVRLRTPPKPTQPFSPIRPADSAIFSAPAPTFPRAVHINQAYTGFFCEENAYRLAQGLLLRPPFVSPTGPAQAQAQQIQAQLAELGLVDPRAAIAAGKSSKEAGGLLEAALAQDRERENVYRGLGLRWGVHVVFASNEGQNVALFAQRAGVAAGRGDGLVIWDYHVFVAVTAYMPIEGMLPSDLARSRRTPPTRSMSLLSDQSNLNLPAFAAATRHAFHPPTGGLVDEPELGTKAWVSKTWIYDFDSSLSYPPEFTVPGRVKKEAAAKAGWSGSGPDGLPPPTAVPLDMYALATLRLNLFESEAEDGASGAKPAAGGGPKLPSRLKPRFRIVPAQMFLDHFASDRRHMKRAGDAEVAAGLGVPGRSRQATVPGSPGAAAAAAMVDDKESKDGEVPDKGLWTQPPPVWASIAGKFARVKGIQNNLFDRYVSMAEGAAQQDDDGLYGTVIKAEEFAEGSWTGAVPAVPGEIKEAALPPPSMLPTPSPTGSVIAPPSGHRSAQTQPPPYSPMESEPAASRALSPAESLPSPNGRTGPPSTNTPPVPPAVGPQPSLAQQPHSQHPAQHQLQHQPQPQQRAQTQPPPPPPAHMHHAQSRPADAAADPRRRTMISHAPPPVPDGPGRQPQPREDSRQQYSQEAQRHHQQQMQPSRQHSQQQQQYEQYQHAPMHQQSARAAPMPSAGAAGIGANGNARRGGRVESPLFAAYLQASYEARATNVTPSNSAGAMMFPSSSLGSINTAGGAAGGGGLGPRGDAGSPAPPMAMMMGAGSMSLLLATSAGGDFYP